MATFCHNCGKHLLTPASNFCCAECAAKYEDTTKQETK